eukprot:symbB.v1.2.010552.t1/scaffold694.1/size172116/15
MEILPEDHELLTRGKVHALPHLFSVLLHEATPESIRGLFMLPALQLLRLDFPAAGAVETLHWTRVDLSALCSLDLLHFRAYAIQVLGGTLPNCWQRMTQLRTFYCFDVRAAWLRGEILESETYPDPLHNCSCHGPNLYQVNTYFVKPKTLAAGGMSYALWLHPGGLPCEVFISHAWAEGVFEFSAGVRSAWPGGHGLTNLYCCLLANPQNLDLEVFLNVDPLMNPFAKALQRASHILVIPNSKISIYSRLWCVYEAYLGTTMEKICLMPATPQLRQQGTSCAKIILTPLLLGIITSLVWQHVIHVDDTTFVFQIMLTCLGLSLLGSLWGIFPPQLTTCTTVARVVHIVVIFIGSAVVLPWWSHAYDASGLVQFLHYFIPLALVAFNMMCLARLDMHHLEFRELAEQAKYLSCQTVQEAACTNPDDERRIRDAICGFEDDVDITVRVLMLAGAYTKDLREAYDSGEDIRGAGILNMKAKVAIGAAVWCLVATDSCTRFARGGIAARRTWMYLNILSVASALSVALGVPLWFRCRPHRPDWLRGTMNVWYLCAVGALLLPYLVGICQGWDELTTISMIARMAYTPQQEPQHFPSVITCIFEVASPPFFALVSVLTGLSGTKSVCRYGPYGQVHRLLDKASRSLSSVVEDGSTTSSSSESEESCACVFST